MADGGSVGRRRVAGCVSAAGLLLVGNLDAIRQVLDGSSAPFDWWRTSRVHAGTLDVTEFPAWAFLFGDLHPHLMGTWLTGLVVLLGVALVAEARPDASPVRRTSLLVVLGVVVGLVLMTHTWDFPAVVVLSSTAVVFARVRSRAHPTRRAVLTGIVVDLVVVGATGFVLTAPYRRRSMVFNDGIDRAPVTTDLVDQLVHLGVWWAVAATFATVLLVVHRPSVVRRRGDWRSVAGPVLIGLGAVAILTGVGLAVSWVAAVSLVLVGLLAVGIVAEFRSDRTDPAVVVTGALLVAGVGLAAVPEFVTIAPDIERLNTVFKLTFEAWHLVALAGGPALVLVAVRLRRRSVRVVAATSGLVALVAVLAFPVLAVRPRLADRVAPDIGPTLDGLAYLDGEWTVVAPDGTPIVPAEDRPLIDWLRHEVGGQPTIVEMVGQAYGWNARVSVYTGLPTVIGWPWHETQQRLGFSDTVERRYADVQRLYTDGDADFASFFLRAHRVEYVVIGTVELATATPEALAVIESLPGAEVVFRDGERRIIGIDQAALGTISS
ncbi:MAG: DUF2298 domain-containing protein [Ilumatobacteraceae bacterium]